MKAWEEHLLSTYALPQTIFNLHRLNKPTLHHYTSFEAFLKIGLSRSLHATCIHYLNDSSEFKGLLAYTKAIMSKIVVVNEVHKDFIGHLQSTFSVIPNMRVFVCSFSEEYDSLSQWRGYADGGGVSVGFGFSSLLRVAENNGVRLVKCIYDAGIQSVIVQELFDRAALRVQEGQRSATIAVEFLSDFFLIAAACKHGAFSEEKEWRLISVPKSSNDEKIEFKSRNNMLVPYMGIDIELADITPEGRSKIAIEHIITGPNVSRELAERSMRDFFDRYQLETPTFDHSAAPYRTSV